jgi:hypothetical protein
VWQAYNDGKRECTDPGAREGTQLEVKCLKG